MAAYPDLDEMITEKDREVLEYLENLEEETFKDEDGEETVRFSSFYFTALSNFKPQTNFLLSFFL